MSGESWTEERDRLRIQLESLEAGEVDHFDDGQTDPLGKNSKEDQVARMKHRLGELDVRLGAPD